MNSISNNNLPILIQVFSLLVSVSAAAMMPLFLCNARNKATKAAKAKEADGLIEQKIIGVGNGISNKNSPILKEEAVVSTVEKKSLIKKQRVNFGWIETLDLDECRKYISTKPTVQIEAILPSNLIVVLDLDQCLVHTIHAGESLGCDEKVLGPATFLRPNLLEFLRTTMSRYETHVFTAANSPHADPILDALVKVVGLPFAGRWYRQHCTECPAKDTLIYVKDLESLQIGNLKKMVLVDNNSLSFCANPSNGIPICDFICEDPRDEGLKHVTTFLSFLESVDDVRPVLDQMFGIKADFDSVRVSHDWFNSVLLEFEIGKRQL